MLFFEQFIKQNSKKKKHILYYKDHATLKNGKMASENSALHFKLYKY